MLWHNKLERYLHHNYFLLSLENLDKIYRLAQAQLLPKLYSPSLILFRLKKILFLLNKTSYLNVEVYCSEPSTSVRVPWYDVQP